jgi:phospholipase A2
MYHQTIKATIFNLFLLTASLHAETAFMQHARHLDRFGLENIYSYISPVINYAQSALASLAPTAIYEWLNEDPYEHVDAQIRITHEDRLCDAEQAFRAQRTAYIHYGLQQLLGHEVAPEHVPTIALCCSGGGYRAMLLTLGFLKGLEDVGLLDCTMYMTGLSGSSWAMAPWVACRKSLDEYLATLPEKLAHGLEAVKNPSQLETIAKQIITKAVYKQHVSLIDIYGTTLANTLLDDFGDYRLNVTLSQTHAHIADGSWPMPIYTAVTPNVEPYEWFEFTPFEMGSSYTRAYIPIWSFGREFHNGASVNKAPEQPLGYMMGIFGSAFEFDIEDAVRQTADSINQHIASMSSEVGHIATALINDIVNSPLDNIRLAPSSLPNFTYQATSCPLHHDEHLTLIDAGIHFNIPFPPVLRAERAVDIIIVCDASADIVGCPNLHWTQEYMERHNLKFPPIDFDTADKQVMSIFRDEHDQTCPIVIYFPRIKNPDYSTTFDPETCLKEYCATTNFTFDSEQIIEIMGFAQFGINQHADAIKEIIEDVITHKMA